MQTFPKWNPDAFPLLGEESTEEREEGQPSRYRYWIERRWCDTPGIMLWIMYNPSWATISSNGTGRHRDMAVPLCFERSQRIALKRNLPIGAMRIVNLFARRSTDTRADGWPQADELNDPKWIGPDNDHHIETQVNAATIVIAGWGAFSVSEKGAQWRADDVRLKLIDPWRLVPKKESWNSHPYYAGNRRHVLADADILLLTGTLR